MILKIPKISVIMPVYNCAPFLRECIESVLNQTYSDFEFLICNDNSTDDSLSILSEYAKSDSRIRILTNKVNLGCTKTLNVLLNEAKGEFIARIDGDDICYPKRFEKQLDVFNSNSDVSLVFTSSNLVDEKSKILCESWRPKKLKTILSLLPLINLIQHPSVMFKKEIVLSCGMYNENILKGQDHNLWLRLKKQGRRFFYLNEILIARRINFSSVSYSTHFNYNILLFDVMINNKQKILAYKYFKKLTLNNKVKKFWKLFIPFYILFFKGLLVRSYHQPDCVNNLKTSNNPN